MLIREKIKSTAVALFIICFACTQVYAFNNIHIGNLEINPFVSLEQKYDDNIFLEPKGQEDSDWITTTILGLGLKMPLVPGREEDFILKLKYDADFIKFWDYTKQDRFDHNLSAIADLKFANDFTLKIEDKFQKTADPPNNELTTLEKRYRNDSKVTLGYLREKIGFDFGYENIRDKYNNLNSLDKYEHVLTATGYYQLLPKTSIFCEYNFGRTIYDNNDTNSDSEYHQYRLGIKGQIAPKLTGLFKAGYKKTDYKDSSKEDFTGFTTFVNVIYNLKERTTLNVYSERGSEESTYSTNSYFEYNKIGLKVDHELMQRLFLVSGGYYQLNKYPEETTEGSLTAKREDKLWDGSIGLRYEVKEWVNIEANYEYKQRDSKFSTYDYKDNRYTVKINFMF
ncbi:MAG: outer membrane beta-barrel protein [Candidatus Omnitrophota bacterium]